MPSLKQHQSNDYTKMLFVGDSKAGKTGALTSLVKAGYKLRILDFDNGLDVLKNYVLRECPDKIDTIEFRSLQDNRKATQAGSVVDKPSAFSNGLKMLDRWKYDDTDLGDPAAWGPDCILVLDSLSRFSDSAFDWAAPMNIANKDIRATYKTAQDGVIDTIATFYGDNFKTNVIVIAHVRYLELPDGTKKGFPQSVGSAISSEIPQYFNTYVLLDNTGGKRVLKTTSTPLIDLANPKPFDMAKTYPIETGLASIFEVLRGPLKPKEAPKLVARRA